MIELLWHILQSLAQGISMLTVCVALCFWMEKRADRKEKEWHEKIEKGWSGKYMDEPENLWMIGWIGIVCFFFFVGCVIYRLLE